MVLNWMTGVNKLCYLKPDNSLMILQNDDGINDIVAFVLELNYKKCVHIYPFDEIIFKQPHLDTQCSANLGSGGFVDENASGFGAGGFVDENASGSGAGGFVNDKGSGSGAGEIVNEKGISSGAEGLINE